MAGSHKRKGRPPANKSPQSAKHTPKRQPKTSPKTVTPMVITSPRVVGKKAPSAVGKIITNADVHVVAPPRVVAENKPVNRAVAKKHMGKRGPSKSAAVGSVVTPPALKKTKIDDSSSR